MFLAGAGQRRVDVLKFRDGFMPYHGAEVKDCFERLKAEVSPDIIFTPHLHDRHQDHRFLAELTWNTFRDHLILEYEIPKYEGDLGQPNVFVPLGETHCRRKIEYLLSCYRTQHDKRWFSDETFRAVLRLRAIECAADSGYAEAFHGRKLLLGSIAARYT
jgi:LmbE family N-acetylglucosaminyl deacetylase